MLLAKGCRLTDRDVALAAAMNHPTVPVHRCPKVALLASGDELVMPGATPGFGQIVHSNGYATMAAARREGCEVVDLGIVPDRLAETAAAVRRARDIGADILVTSGGASVGRIANPAGEVANQEHDLASQVLELAQLAQHDGVSDVDNRAGRIDAKVDPNLLARAQPALELVAADHLDDTPVEQLLDRIGLRARRHR